MVDRHSGGFGRHYRLGGILDHSAWSYSHSSPQSIGFRRYSFGPRDLKPFEIVEREAMEGDNTWFVALVTSSGKRFQTHDLQTRSAAEQMRDRILREFDD